MDKKLSAALLLAINTFIGDRGFGRARVKWVITDISAEATAIKSQIIRDSSH